MDDEIIIQAGEDEVIEETPADCFPEHVYLKFPFLAGDDDAPFWQGWANLRLKTFQLIENKYFETAVITMILLSSLALVSRLFFFLSICRARLRNYFPFAGFRRCPSSR